MRTAARAAVAIARVHGRTGRLFRTSGHPDIRTEGLKGWGMEGRLLGRKGRAGRKGRVQFPDNGEELVDDDEKARAYGEVAYAGRGIGC